MPPKHGMRTPSACHVLVRVDMLPFHRHVTLGEYAVDWGGDPTLYGDEWLR